MLLGIILMLLGILGGASIFAYIIIEEKKRKRAIEKKKKMARMKKQKMKAKKLREMAIEKVIEDDVKIYMPKRSGFNLENLTHAN